MPPAEGSTWSVDQYLADVLGSIDRTRWPRLDEVAVAEALGRTLTRGILATIDLPHLTN